jgi:hypothetical protein
MRPSPSIVQETLPYHPKAVQLEEPTKQLVSQFSRDVLHRRQTLLMRLENEYVADWVTVVTMLGVERGVTATL